MSSIVIATVPLTVPKEEVFAMGKDDEDLVYVIGKHRKKLEGMGVEVYATHKNIIVTDQGYHCAFFESDLEKVDPS